jgi:microcystin-dependent protein
MPIASETSRVQYTGNNSTSTSYGVPFYFLANADIQVVLADAAGIETQLVETTHYALTGAGNPAGGSLTTGSSYDNTHTLTIYREPLQTQSTQFQSTGALPADTLTRGLDKLTMLVQSLGRKVARAVRLNDKAEALNAFSETNKAGTVCGFNASGELTLYDRTLMLSLLSLGGSITGLPTAYWADSSERSAKQPDFAGQIGIQLDTSALYRASGTSIGNWSLLLLDEDNMASDSSVRPPSQQSVKAYVDSQNAASLVTAAANASASDATYLPPGVIVSCAAPTAPTGWLFCYGQAVSRTSFGPLFSAIGTIYGAGDGSTTFNLPDLRGRVAAGKDDMGGIAASRLTNSGTGNPGVNGANLGATGGMDRHTLSTAQMPSHSHSYLTLTAGAGVAGGSGFAGTNSTTGSAGSGEAHANVQPTLIVNFIIRT